MAEKGELEEEIKDRKMMEGLAKNGWEKKMQELEECLQNKQF